VAPIMPVAHGEFLSKYFSHIKFKLESPQHVEQIMKELEKLDMTKLETKYDIIGTIYEYHLKSGTSNAMRDLGQYYTNRQVIEFMIKLCDINMNKKGEIETIIDPTMGTGGFLTMSVKYLNDKYKNKIDWSKNKNRIYGFDIDENVKNMAMLNMLLECGEFCENTFIKNDTLYNDFKLKNGEILEKVDVILANEPMGIKNIIHANCCEKIKELKFRGTKAEPLFLQLFMQSLNENGRCAVIVPDGVLFNDSNLHSDTRKHLVENFNLKKVISLNDDFFLNTGVKTSILYFVN
jgi:type I restriction enzyme M protein